MCCVVYALFYVYGNEMFSEDSCYYNMLFGFRNGETKRVLWSMNEQVHCTKAMQF